MNIPKELFKYRDFGKYSVLSLLNKGLWIPKPSQLNDPFDAQLKLSKSDVNSKQFKEALSHFMSSSLNSKEEVLDPEFIDSLFINGKPNDYLKDKVNQFCRFWDETSDSVGILSLSEDPISTTMWSHYGDEHKGICLGYDPEILAPESPNGAGDWLRKVTYKNEIDIVRNAYLLFAMTGMSNCHYSLMELFYRMLSTKSSDWEYEKEWRFLCPDIGGCVYKLNIDAITSVTFGLRTTVETKTAVGHLLRYHKKPTQFYQVIRSEHTVGLERVRMIDNKKYWYQPYE
ncbi:DUF2971 domain-containing protein [Vibrio sp. 1F255]|uniref:DUF2971 domain-containing protein n=1 Tax=Vibrio sp. 1F255 TaxID=3230009 RepID=UPI00352BD49D